MRSTRVRSITALLACIGCGLFVSAPIGALAAPAAHSVASAKSHPVGFFITGQGEITKGSNASALVRDSNGGEHVVTSVVSKTASGDRGHLVYLTKAPGTSKWIKHAIPGLQPMAGGIQVEEHLSLYRPRVFAVFYECNGVYVSDASYTATRLPKPTLVKSEDNCTSPPPAVSGPINDAIALPGGDDQIGVLLPDPNQSNDPTLYTGSPGGTFTPQPALPTTDSFVPSMVTIDAQDGKITVVGQGSDGTNEGVYVVTKPYYVSTWSTPTLIASMSLPTQDFTIQSVTANNGATWVGLRKPRVTGVTQKYSLFVDHGTSTGQWIGAVHLPHSILGDSALVLSINADTGNLHAAFTRAVATSKTKKSGIITEARVSGKWTDVKFLTHWYHDRTAEITYTASGHAVVGYTQR
jgi:hypothetical protein